MLTQVEWKAREKEVAKLEADREALNAKICELKAERDKVSERIHTLSVHIRAYKKRVENPKPINTNTFAYQMFGKRLKDLTPNEYRIYYNARQRINRIKRKENTL